MYFVCILITFLFRALAASPASVFTCIFLMESTAFRWKWAFSGRKDLQQNNGENSNKEWAGFIQIRDLNITVFDVNCYPLYICKSIYKQIPICPNCKLHLVTPAWASHKRQLKHCNFKSYIFLNTNSLQYWVSAQFKLSTPTALSFNINQKSDVIAVLSELLRKSVLLQYTFKNCHCCTVNCSSFETPKYEVLWDADQWEKRSRHWEQVGPKKKEANLQQSFTVCEYVSFIF